MIARAQAAIYCAATLVMDQNPSFSQLAPEAIGAARVAALYRQAVPGLVVTLGVAAVCVAVLWQAVDHGVLATWIAGMAVIIGLRLLFVRAYRSKERNPEQAPKWERRFAAGAALTGAVWGTLPTLIDPSNFTLQLFGAFVIGGMAMGALGVHSPSRAAFLWFVGPMFAVLELGYIRLGGGLYPALGVTGLLFLGAAVSVFGNLHRTVTQNIERGIVNDRLLAEQRGLFEAATVGLAFVREHALVDCNLEFARIFGWAREELLRSTHERSFLADARWRELIDDAYARTRVGNAYRDELQLQRKDGTLAWCDVSAQAVIPGKPDLGLVISYADISERKNAEAALRASEGRLDLVVRASQGGYWDWDTVARSGYFSPRFKEILGYAADADFTAPLFFEDRLHPDDADRVLALWKRTMTVVREPFDGEFRLRGARGNFVWVHARGLVLCDATGQPVRSVGSLIDISDRKQIEDELRQSEQHFRNLVEAANDLIWAVDREGRWTYLSPRATRQIFGCEAEEMLRHRLVESQPETERERTRAMLARVLDDGTASHFETEHLNRSGESVVLSFNATPLRGEGGAIEGVTGIATDISNLKAKEAELSAALAEQQLIFESVSEGIVFMKQRIVHKCNAKFAQMLGYRPEELVRRPSLVWYADPVEWEHLGRQARATMAQGLVYESELLVRRKDGTTFWCEVRGRAVDPQDIYAGTIFIYIDISARKEREERVQHLADHDALTGLLNRRLLQDRLQHAINLARRSDSLVAVMLIDLDGFKAVNDQFGHLMGDYVLRIVAKRLSECVRESDTVARLGGDEFVVLLIGQHLPTDSTLVAEKILSAFTEPVAAGGRRFLIGASIGISVFPRDGTTPDALLKHADAAMYRVKEAGKNRYEFYAP